MNTLYQSLQHYLSTFRIVFNNYDKLYLHHCNIYRHILKLCLKCECTLIGL